MAAMPDASELTERIRHQLLGAIHIGELRAGDRLPSIREVARTMGEDQRRVARAYRVLEAEGLVEVRGRSGVYAASQSRVRGGLLEETDEWLAQVLLEGWTRRIPIDRLPDVIRRHSSAAPPRCAMLDSCEDAIEAFAHELGQDFGFAVSPTRLDTLRSDTSLALLPEGLRSADLIVTTIFSAVTAREIAQRLNRPMITVRVHPDAAATVIAKLKNGKLTVVCADPSFGDRIRLQYAEHLRDADQIRVVLANDHRALAALDPSDPVMLTRAARSRIPAIRLNMLIPHSPTLSPASAREILRFLIRRHSPDDDVGTPES
jgi:DNA-binding transcriptional regulator YhcF (GntR family)